MSVLLLAKIHQATQPLPKNRCSLSLVPSGVLLHPAKFACLRRKDLH